MTLKPPAASPLTSNWDLEDEDAGATREVEPDELFARAGLMPGGGPPLAGSDVEGARVSAPSPTATMRPSMTQEEYVDQMMRMAPPSDTGLTALGAEFSDDFGALTPWAASAPNDREPPSISALFEHDPSAPRSPSGDDPGAAGSGSLSEVDFSDIMPLITPRRRPPTMPPRSAVDELDELLSDEVRRTVRRDERPMTEAPRAGDDGGDLGIDLEFDDPSFIAPAARVDDRADAADLELGAFDTSPFDLDDRTAVELPDDPALSPEALDDEGIEPSPDTMVEAAFPKEAPLALPEGSIQSRLERLRARFEVGDYSGALVIAEGMLDEAPRHLAARCYAESCRAMLQQMYQARIGDRSKRLQIIMGPDQLRSLSLDHRTGFLLSCIDGSSTIDDILDISGMQPLDALRMLYDLLQQGVIDTEAPPSSPG